MMITPDLHQTAHDAVKAHKKIHGPPPKCVIYTITFLAVTLYLPSCWLFKATFRLSLWAMDLAHWLNFGIAKLIQKIFEFLWTPAKEVNTIQKMIEFSKKASGQ